MADATATIGELKDAVRAFAAERTWEKFHAPKNLVMALVCEVAELTEPFLWVDADASRHMANDPHVRPNLADELADVFILTLNLSLSMNIDLSEATRAKLIKNAAKYPAQLAGA